MLRGDDQRTRRNLVYAAILGPGVTDHAHQPDTAEPPILGDIENAPARHQEGRDTGEDPEHQHRIEQNVVDQRTQKNRNHRKSDPNYLAWAVAGVRGTIDSVG